MPWNHVLVLRCLNLTLFIDVSEHPGQSNIFRNNQRILRHENRASGRFVPPPNPTVQVIFKHLSTKNLSFLQTFSQGHALESIFWSQVLQIDMVYRCFRTPQRSKVFRINQRILRHENLVFARFVYPPNPTIQTVLCI